jgi:hypothetical protein
VITILKIKSLEYKDGILKVIHECGVAEGGVMAPTYAKSRADTVIKKLRADITRLERENERLQEIVNWPAKQKAMLKQANETPCSNCGTMPYRRNGNITHGCPGKSPRCYSSEDWIKENT